MIMRSGPKWLLLCAAITGSVAGGCGYSEDEMQAKLRDIERFKTDLAAEQERNRKAKAETA